MDEFWERGLILRVLAGSRAQGLARENSDTDSRGVCIPPAHYLIGLGEFEQHESPGKDHVTFSLAKFVRLALQGNPNVLEVLYTNEDDFMHVTDAGRALIDAREGFLSKKVGARFLGYARAQWKRVERHRRWIADPPEGPPDPAAYGATTVGGRSRFTDAKSRKAFDAAVGEWRHYETWRSERNAARAELERRHGYDTKHAMHLVRLLTMGVEVLEHGELIVRRPDAERLWAIRDGALSFEELRALTDERAREIEAMTRTTRLPDEPDRGAADELLVRLHADALAAEGFGAGAAGGDDAPGSR